MKDPLKPFVSVVFLAVFSEIKHYNKLYYCLLVVCCSLLYKAKHNTVLYNKRQFIIGVNTNTNT